MMARWRHIKFLPIYVLLLVIVGGLIVGLKHKHDLDRAKLGMSPLKRLSAEWVPLLDPTLSQWEIWMGAPHRTVRDLPSGTPLSENGQKGVPLGLNNDPKHVFRVETDTQEPLLHITGEIFGGLTTRFSYSNYHFRCQFKWGNLIWEPKLKALRDNGILFHCTGPHGAFWEVWKRSVEFQVEDSNMGDLFLLAGTHADVSVYVDPSNPKKIMADPNGEIINMKNKLNGNRVMRLPGNFESPMGEWSALDLYTIGRTAVFVVNGTVVQILRNMSVDLGEKGEQVPLTAGQIQLQSEGAEAFYRRLEIRSLSEYPPEIQKIAQFKKSDL